MQREESYLPCKFLRQTAVNSESNENNVPAPERSWYILKKAEDSKRWYKLLRRSSTFFANDSQAKRASIDYSFSVFH